MSTGATTKWNIPLFGDTDFVTPIQTPLNSQSNALDTALTNLVNGNGYQGPYPSLATLNLPANAGTAVGQHAIVNADSTAANNGDYRWNGSAWVATASGIGGSVKRTTGAASFGGSAWNAITNTTFWTADQPASGLNAFNGTWVAPVAGVYDVRGGIQLATTVNAILAIKKNDSTASVTGAVAQNTAAGLANDTAVQVSKLIRLNANDFVCLAIFPSATATWDATFLDSSFFSIRYVEPLR